MRTDGHSESFRGLLISCCGLQFASKGRGVRCVTSNGCPGRASLAGPITPTSSCPPRIQLLSVGLTRDLEHRCHTVASDILRISHGGGPEKIFSGFAQMRTPTGRTAEVADAARAGRECPPRIDGATIRVSPWWQPRDDFDADSLSHSRPATSTLERAGHLAAIGLDGEDHRRHNGELNGPSGIGKFRGRRAGRAGLSAEGRLSSYERFMKPPPG
jgi:hypothetical protein